MSKNLVLFICLSIYAIGFANAEIQVSASQCTRTNGVRSRCFILKDTRLNKQYKLIPFRNSNLEYNKLLNELNRVARNPTFMISRVFPNGSSTLDMNEASITFQSTQGGSAFIDQSTIDLRYLTRKMQECESRQGVLRGIGSAIGVVQSECSRRNIVETHRNDIDPDSRFRFENYGKSLPTRYGEQPTAVVQ